MWHFLIYRNMLTEARPDDMTIVMDIVEYYTNKHGVTTDTLENRIHFFKDWALRTDRKADDIQETKPYKIFSPGTSSFDIRIR